MIHWKDLEVGDEIIYKGCKWTWFVNVKENCDKLTVDSKYIVSKIEVASSWTCIFLEGYGEDRFCLGAFDWYERME